MFCIFSKAETQGLAEPNLSESYNVKDVGSYPTQYLSANAVESFVHAGPHPFPPNIPNDDNGMSFPYNILQSIRANEEKRERDYLSYSPDRQSVYCFPCRLFLHKTPLPHIAQLEGSGKSLGWRRLYCKLKSHEDSSSHKDCMFQWRELEARLKNHAQIENLIDKSLVNQASKWRDILKRILDVVLFLGERSLAFRGGSEKFGDPHNGNFLGIIELLSNYDPVLKEHVIKVSNAQNEGTRLQAHYLSQSSQNEFIYLCAQKVRDAILQELQSAKYYSIMVDGTPDESCIEQCTFVFRYVLNDNGVYSIKVISSAPSYTCTCQYLLKYMNDVA